MRSRSTSAALAAAGLLVLAVAGCRRSGSGDQASRPAGPPPIEQVKERGPVKVRLHVEPPEPTFADRVRFSIEATAKKGTRVTLPSPGENLGEFLIKDYDSPPERATADATEYRRSYTLEFLTSGDYTIPPMTIAFRTADPDHAPAEKSVDPVPSEAKAESQKSKADPQSNPSGAQAASRKPQADPSGTGTDADTESAPEYKIVTDEIKIRVKPLADAASIKELAPIAPPAEPPLIAPGLFWPLVIGGALAAVAITAFLVVRLLRRERPAPPPIPPHERAYRELEWLLGQGFIDRGELKEFFFHLSRILREYIEGRFGLRAPELTTEEFLIELIRKKPGEESAPARTPDDGGIPRDHQPLLRDFLERADLVKFAKYTPGREEIEGSFEASKRFIEATIASGSNGAPGPVRTLEEAAHERRG
jgi:hypothetical protein